MMRVAFLLLCSSASALLVPAAFARPAVYAPARCAAAAMCSPLEPAVARVGKRQRALALLRIPAQALARPARAVGKWSPVKRVAGALALAGMSLFLQTSGPSFAAGALFPAHRTLEFAKTAEEKRSGAICTVALIGSIAAYTFYLCDKDDKEEKESISAENKRLEQLASDFKVNDTVFKDEDVMASLRKRREADKKKKDGEGGGDAPSAGGDDKPSSGPPPAPSGGSSAVLEPPSGTSDTPPQPDAESTESTASAEDVERLKRMFNLGEDK